MSNPIDFKLTKTDGGFYDLEVSSTGDMVLTDALDTAILISLLMEKRATASEVATAKLRRGWWGNTFNDDGFEIGSKLWLLEQARLNSTTASNASSYARESLQWMIDDGIFDEISVSSSLTVDGISINAKLTADNSTETFGLELVRNTVS